jgi:hypothetical protein
MNSAVETLVRSLELPQLGVLKILVNAKNGVSSNQEISSTTGTASTILGSLLTPLRRKKVDGESLIIQAGRDPDKGTRWQVNEKLVSIDDLNALLVSMRL